MQIEDLVATDTSRLTPADVQAAADTVNLDAAILWAVVDVESNGRGFREDNLPTFRFESHIFQREVPSWPSGDNPNSRLTLEKAMNVDEGAALRSTSWGLFQIMGFNYGVCGFPTVEAMVRASLLGERGQLLVGLSFIREGGLLDELRARNWAGFARQYNGPGYRQNLYDQKLATQYERRLREQPGMSLAPNGALKRLLIKGTKGDDVRQLKRMLNKVGGLPFPLDDTEIFDVGTEEHVIDFQKAYHLGIDGKVGPQTWGKLVELTK